MSLNLGTKVLAGAIAMAIGGGAMAQTSLNTTTGDLFLNIVDQTNQSSFTFDTGITQAAFNGSGSYSFNVASDPNYQAFIAAAGSNALTYDVVSATNQGPTNPTRDTVDFTSAIGAPGSTLINHGQQGAAESIVQGFDLLVNAAATTTTNSVLLSGINPVSAEPFYWGDVSQQGVWSVQLLNTGTGDSAAPGTALQFFSENNATLITEAGDWNLNGASLTYSDGSGGPSPVPLPTPVLLLLSGLGLMGVVARRGKSSAGDLASGGAAV